MTGLLRKRIEILKSTRVPDEAGGASRVWSPVEAVWAGLERLASTRDLTGAGGRLRRLAVTIRWRNSIALGQRARIDGENFEIVSIESDDEKERRMTLICEETPS